MSEANCGDRLAHPPRQPINNYTTT